MNILAARDQENLIHGHHTAAAAKPLNQGLKGLAPKTPGNNGQKSTLNGRMTIRNRGRDDENAVEGAKQKKAEKLTFVTPVAPRDRAPLGAKATNVKAKAFQTPGPLTGGNGLQKTQRKSNSARKPKLKIHQPEVVEAEPLVKAVDDEEPDIEYCPPKITELPHFADNPYEFGPDETFPQFQGANKFRGWLTYHSFYDEDNKDREREAAEKAARLEVETDRKIQESIESMPNLEQQLGRELELQLSNNTSTNELASARLKGGINITGKTSPSINPQSAAAALSTKPPPRFAAPTTATKAKRVSTLSKPTPRNTPGTVASHTTIGYSAGRKVSSSMKGDSNTPSRKVSINETLPVSQLLSRLLMGDDDEDDEEDLDAIFLAQSGKKDWLQEFAEADFRLEMPKYDG